MIFTSAARPSANMCRICEFNRLHNLLNHREWRHEFDTDCQFLFSTSRIHMYVARTVENLRVGARATFNEEWFFCVRILRQGNSPNILTRTQVAMETECTGLRAAPSGRAPQPPCFEPLASSTQSLWERESWSTRYILCSVHCEVVPPPFQVTPSNLHYNWQHSKSKIIHLFILSSQSFSHGNYGQSHFVLFSALFFRSLSHPCWS